MAKLTRDEVNEKNLDFITKFEFQEMHEISRQNVDYLIKKNKIDYMRPAHEFFIVLSEKTLKYKKR